MRICCTNQLCCLPSGTVGGFRLPYLQVEHPHNGQLWSVVGLRERLNAACRPVGYPIFLKCVGA
jgi:hypothetical protein